MKKPNSRPTLGELKQHLTCSLCSGYLTEAATINKCLHSFCHPCIVRHLTTNNSCPTCGRNLHARRPLSKIRRDRTLQRLVYKTVPGLLKRTEVSDNSKELDLDPDPLSDPLFPTNDFFSICLEQKSRRSEIGPLTRILDSLLSLVVDDLKIEEPRYLFCAAIMKLKILKKFICFKFDLSPRYEIGMMCCNELFDDDSTLLDVAYISRWTVAEPLKLQYLILDKEKLLATQVEESANPVLDAISQDDQPSIGDHPSSVSGTPVDPSTTNIQNHPGPDDPLEEKTSAIATIELETLVPPTPVEPRKAQGSSSTKKKRGRKQRPADSSKSVSDDIPNLDKNIAESINPDKSTSPATNAEAPSVVDPRSAKKRGRKRKSESSGLLVASLDEKNDEVHSKKRADRLSGTCVEDTVSADISSGIQDTPVTKKLKSGAPHDQPPFVPDSAAPEHHQSPADDGDKQPAKTDAVSNSCENRIGTLKISLDGQHIVRNVTSPTDNADLRLGEKKKGNTDKNLTTGQYKLKRKDDLRLQLSRKTKSSHPQDEEDISKEKPELTPVDRKKTLRVKKTSPQKTKKRPEASKVHPSDIVDHDHLTVTPRSLDKKCARVIQKVSLPGGDYGSPDTELYIRSSVVRKKRSPSITETPSPVVYDRDIETSPFLKRGNDKKSSRFLGRKSVLGKIPKAVSISTIPPTTFVLAAERKQGNQSSGDKMMDDIGEPVSLKVVLRMVDDRKQSVAHDRTDDCFMVSSTVADDEAELAGAGSGNSLDESPDSHGISESRAALDAKRTVPVSSDPARLQPSTVSELSPFVHLVSDPPPSVTPNKNLTPNDAVRPLPSVGCSDGQLPQGKKPLVPPTGTVSTGKVDRGAKRKRLESVISSLKPVAAVTVSTDPVQPAPSRQPSIPNNVAVVPWDSSTARSKFTPPPTGFTRTPGKPSDTTPSLLHRLVSSREPLNIPVPTLRHQWQQQQPRAAVYPPVRFPPNSHYQVRPQGLPPPRAPPRNTQRQQRPRGGAPRGRAPTGQQQQHQARAALRYPTASNAHIAAAAYAMGLLQAQRQTRPPPPPPPPPPHSVYHRGWTPDQDRLRFFAPGASGMRSGVVVRSRPALEPNGYDAPLELTTKKSRDVSA